ncbi:MAG: phosphotransferase enzyme family protein [Promethearchaeota archaeon]
MSCQKKVRNLNLQTYKSDMVSCDLIINMPNFAEKSLISTKLPKLIQKEYNLEVKSINLHREMIGLIYFVQTAFHQYVIKIYRPENYLQAVQSLKIIKFLQENNYPVAPIIPTKNGSIFSILEEFDGKNSNKWVMALFAYIQAEPPELQSELETIGKQVRKLHILMENYKEELPLKGREFYLDRFISLLIEKKFNQKYIRELQNYGDEIWSILEKLPKGYCHGDLHSGNMFKTNPGEYTLIDFDASAYSFPIIDIATICDATNFNQLQPEAFDQTMVNLECFLKGYGKNLSNDEITGIFYFIAARHYELIATIAQARGLDRISDKFLQEQYYWLKNWRLLCRERL